MSPESVVATIPIEVDWAGVPFDEYPIAIAYGVAPKFLGTIGRAFGKRPPRNVRRLWPMLSPSHLAILDEIERRLRS